MHRLNLTLVAPYALAKEKRQVAPEGRRDFFCGVRIETILVSCEGVRSPRYFTED